MKAKKNEFVHQVMLSEEELEILEFIGAYLHLFAERIRENEEIIEDFEGISKDRSKIGF